MSVKTEKIVVFDSGGNPKELRYYEAEKLIARLGTILDGDSNFIGLRELDIEEVSPSSWLDKLRHKPQPKRIDILTVDFIGLINWINTIKTIKTIENIANIASLDLIDRITLIDTITAITNIANIASLDLIDRITLIDAITSIGTISSIGEIKSSMTQTDFLVNQHFQSGLEHWRYSDASIVAESEGNLGVNVCKIGTATSAYVLQDVVPIKPSSRITVDFLLKVSVNDSSIKVTFLYTDGTNEDFTFANAVSGYFLKVCVPTTTKSLWSVQFINNTVGNYCYVKDIRIYSEALSDVTQATRTSLKVQSEREDLLLKSQDVTAGTTSILASVASQKHKIYGWDYESDTDGTNEFQCTVNSVASKFGRRTTKGVHAMTLVHPVVCDANTVLGFISTGNTKLSVRYKTEA